VLERRSRRAYVLSALDAAPSRMMRRSEDERERVKAPVERRLRTE
jgi:hypothetical protein